MVESVNTGGLDGDDPGRGVGVSSARGEAGVLGRDDHADEDGADDVDCGRKRR